MKKLLAVALLGVVFLPVLASAAGNVEKIGGRWDRIISTASHYVNLLNNGTEPRDLGRIQALIAELKNFRGQLIVGMPLPEQKELVHNFNSRVSDLRSYFWQFGSRYTHLRGKPIVTR